MRLGEAEIHLGCTNQETRCLHLVLDKSIKVPGHFEMIIPVKITGQEENFFLESSWTRIQEGIRVGSVCEPVASAIKREEPKKTWISTKSSKTANGENSRGVG